VLVQPRYIAPFLVLLLLGFSRTPLSGSPCFRQNQVLWSRDHSRQCIRFFCVLHFFAPGTADSKSSGRGSERYRAAESLNRNGVLPGQSVGLIGSGWDGMVWARLARVRIVAQIPPDNANRFWQAPDPPVKTGVYDAFARVGAKAVITEETPPSTGFEDWQRVGDTHYYVHFLALPQS